MAVAALLLIREWTGFSVGRTEMVYDWWVNSTDVMTNQETGKLRVLDSFSLFSLISFICPREIRLDFREFSIAVERIVLEYGYGMGISERSGMVCGNTAVVTRCHLIYSEAYLPRRTPFHTQTVMIDTFCENQCTALIRLLIRALNWVKERDKLV